MESGKQLAESAEKLKPESGSRKWKPESRRQIPTTREVESEKWIGFWCRLSAPEQNDPPYACFYTKNTCPPSGKQDVPFLQGTNEIKRTSKEISAPTASASNISVREDTSSNNRGRNVRIATAALGRYGTNDRYGQMPRLHVCCYEKQKKEIALKKAASVRKICACFVHIPYYRYDLALQMTRAW